MGPVCRLFVTSVRGRPCDPSTRAPPCTQAGLRSAGCIRMRSRCMPAGRCQACCVHPCNMACHAVQVANWTEMFQGGARMNEHAGLAVRSCLIICSLPQCSTCCLIAFQHGATLPCIAARFFGMYIHIYICMCNTSCRWLVSKASQHARSAASCRPIDNLGSMNPGHVWAMLIVQRISMWA